VGLTIANSTSPTGYRLVVLTSCRKRDLKLHQYSDLLLFDVSYRGANPSRREANLNDVTNGNHPRITE
jgi:hypothetical protein